MITPVKARHGWMPTPIVPSIPSRFQHLKRSRRLIKEWEKEMSVIKDMPRFNLAGGRRCLWVPANQARKGKYIYTLGQKTGSCVGNAAQYAAQYRLHIEWTEGDQERQDIVPFLPYHYGRGRLHSGIRGRGEGSTGIGQAKALVKDGIIIQTSELPPHSNNDADMNWGSNVEMDWSAGERIAQKYLDIGRKHLFSDYYLVTTYEQARDTIMLGHPVPVASSRGFQMRPQKRGGKMFGIPSGTWMHNMIFIAVDDEPQYPGLYCLNSWTKDAHGPPANDEPWGGFWVDPDTCNYMLGQRDSYGIFGLDSWDLETALSLI